MTFNSVKCKEAHMSSNKSALTDKCADSEGAEESETELPNTGQETDSTERGVLVRRIG